MKYFYTFTFLLLIFTSCLSEKEDFLLETDNLFTKNSNLNCTLCPPEELINVPVYDNKHLIVQFTDNITQAEKENLHVLFNVTETVLGYEVCQNCDGTIEKWSFSDSGSVSLEHKKASIRKKRKSSKPEGLLNVDNEFTFNFENDLSAIGSNLNGGYASQVRNTNNVTIAVLDSGIDAMFNGFPSPFLYNSMLASQYYPSDSGWNFVNNRDDCFDDYPLQHGTKVSYIINNKLNALGVPHQILPVKISGTNGSASYFNILCGMKFVENKADIVQMSFGWYSNDDDDDNTIFENLFTRTENKILYVTSAGNNGTNNDIKTHYPSSFPSNNIIAIAAIDSAKMEIAHFSNYGSESVDFYAPGENIAYPNVVNGISGTSFAAPYVAAIAAKFAQQNRLLTPVQLIGQLEAYGTPIVIPTPDVEVKFELLID